MLFNFNAICSSFLCIHSTDYSSVVYNSSEMGNGENGIAYRDGENGKIRHGIGLVHFVWTIEMNVGKTKWIKPINRFRVGTTPPVVIWLGENGKGIVCSVCFQLCSPQALTSYSYQRSNEVYEAHIPFCRIFEKLMRFGCRFRLNWIQLELELNWSDTENNVRQSTTHPGVHSEYKFVFNKKRKDNFNLQLRVFLNVIRFLCEFVAIFMKFCPVLQVKTVETFHSLLEFGAKFEFSPEEIRISVANVQIGPFWHVKTKACTL